MGVQSSRSGARMPGLLPLSSASRLEAVRLRMRPGGGKTKYHRPQVTTAVAVAVCQSRKTFRAHFCLGHVLINAGIGRMSALGANRTRRDSGNDANDPEPT